MRRVLPELLIALIGRFGPTDIYSVMETPVFSDAGVEETLAVGLMVDGGADEKVILFVKV